MNEWRNWSGIESSRPTRVFAPTSTDDVVAAVQDAAERGGTVKMVGTGHSFTAISAPEDTMLRPEGLRGIESVNHDAMTITAGAGTPLHLLNDAAARQGLSLHNMGDIAEQTLAGAVSTGTHGTGGVKASVSAQLAGLQMVTGDGSVIEASPDENPEVFAAARIGLGALGILTRLTFEMEPLGVLEAHERPMSWEAALADYDEMVAAGHHTDMYWFPHTDHVHVKTNTRVDLDPDEAERLSAFRSWLDDDFMSNTAFGALNAVGNRAPRLIAPFNQMAGRLLSERRYSD
ncbi:MAG: FAD-binding protein, partial [Nocardioides sp.]|nr:FAD-binding protein [Nocardioides sp.]